MEVICLANEENIRRGTAEIVILHILLDGDTYGYELTQKLEKRSEGYYSLPEGTLYPILYRLVDRGYISSYSEMLGKRKRQYYHLEELGKQYYQELLDGYEKITRGIRLIIDGNGGNHGED